MGSNPRGRKPPFIKLSLWILAALVTVQAEVSPAHAQDIDEPPVVTALKGRIASFKERQTGLDALKREMSEALISLRFDGKPGVRPVRKDIFIQRDLLGFESRLEAALRHLEEKVLKVEDDTPELQIGEIEKAGPIAKSLAKEVHDLKGHLTLATLGTLADLLILRGQVGAPLSSETWHARFSLKIPVRMIEDTPFEHAPRLLVRKEMSLARVLVGRSNGTFKASNYATASKDGYFLIQVDPDFVLGLEAGKIAARAGTRSVLFELSKVLLTQKLKAELAQAQSMAGRPIQNLELGEELEQSSNETALRQTLVELLGGPDVFTEKLVTKEFIDSIDSKIWPTDERLHLSDAPAEYRNRYATLREGLKARLQEAEAEGLKKSLLLAVQEWPLALSAYPEAELETAVLKLLNIAKESQLRTVIDPFLGAQKNLIQENFDRLAKEIGARPGIPEQMKKDNIAAERGIFAELQWMGVDAQYTIKEKAAEFTEKFKGPALRMRLAGIQKESREKRLQERWLGYVAHLLTLSEKLTHSQDEKNLQLEVDYGLLNEALATSFAQMALTRQAQRIKDEMILSNPTLMTAQLKQYAYVLAVEKAADWVAESCKARLDVDPVDSNRVVQVTRTRTWLQGLRPRVTGRELSICEEQKKTLDQVLTIGEWFGWTEQGQDETVYLSQLSYLSPEQKEAYKQRWRDRELTHFPILALPVEFPGLTKKTLLFEKLGKLSPSSRTALREAEDLVREAALATERHLGEALQKVARAEKLEDLVEFVARSNYLRLQLQISFPIVASEQRELIETLVKDAELLDAFNNLKGQYFLTGIAYLGLKYLPDIGVRLSGVLARKLGFNVAWMGVAHRFQALDQWMSPFFKGWVMNVLVGASAVVETRQIYKHSDRQELLEGFFFTSLDTRNPVFGSTGMMGHEIYRQSAEEYESEWTTFIWNRAADAAYVGLYFGGFKKIHHLWLKWRGQYLEKAFRGVGFGPGEFCWNEVAIGQMAQLSRQRVESWQMLSLAERQKLLYQIEIWQSELIGEIESSVAKITRENWNAPQGATSAAKPPLTKSEIAQIPPIWKTLAERSGSGRPLNSITVYDLNGMQYLQTGSKLDLGVFYGPTLGKGGR